MEGTIAYLESYRKLIDDHLASINKLLQDENIVSMGREYSESKNSQCEMPFNVFTMVSDLYYRENFHSDIIQAFLDPSGKHNAGKAFLFAFIDCLNEKFNKTIDKYAYQYATVEREVGNQESRIDILISSKQSKHCIIIENKIYDAGDMGRQLPRYYDLMTERGFEVDAIVYIPLDVHKEPEKMDWSDTDKQNVEPRFCNLPAYSKDGINLVDGWLIPCTQKSDNIDCISTLRQYAELVKHLNNDIMDSIILKRFYESLLEGNNLETAISVRNMLNDLPMSDNIDNISTLKQYLNNNTIDSIVNKKFYESLLQDNNLETAISVRNMLNDLPTYMAERLSGYFHNVEGPIKVGTWKNCPGICFLDFSKDDQYYRIDICVLELNYIIRVYNYYNTSEEFPDIKILNDFTKKDEFSNTKTFNFLEENKVKDCVKKIILELLQHIDNKK